MWIKREIHSFLQADRSPIQVIRGPRQCGKTSLVLKLEPAFREVSLDDYRIRELAKADPELLIKQFGGKYIFFDEAQYAPELFPAIKRIVDLEKRSPHYKPETLFRMTGSNQILMDREVKESLAGRASFFDLNTCSISELLAERTYLIQDILFQGGWPDLYRLDLDATKFLNSYIDSYIEKDIVLSAGIQKRNEFRKFIGVLAGRVGQLVDNALLSQSVGVDAKTIREWTSVLESMRVISLVPPYFSNLTNRLVKSPKLYFTDTGLASRLQGWTQSTTLLTSPAQGSLFENLVYAEIYKFCLNRLADIQIFHWRSKDKEEIDFLLKAKQDRFLFIEAKVSPPSKKVPLASMPQVRKVFSKNLPDLIYCHQEGSGRLGSLVPVSNLADYLEEWLEG